MNSKISKITTILIVLSCMLVGIQAQAQTAKITVDTKKEISLVEFFKKVEGVSDYLFQYKDKDVENVKVSLSVRNVSINQLMERALSGTTLNYKVNQRYVFVEQSVKSVKEQGLFKISGSVVDKDRQPLPGVYVIENGSTSNAVATDLDGKFTIQIKNTTDASIVFSCFGFKSKTIQIVKNEPSLRVVLEENTTLLDEVVVVGYGVQKKENLTGAVATTSGEVLSERPIANVAQGLQGVIPNLNISFNSGKPDSPAKVNIRGNTSLNGGNALILLDGVEISDLSLVNPQDIENISVLKDASAAAVYGARAAFGVMLITTKKGTENNKTQVNYNNNISWSTPARLSHMKMPRSDVWAEMWNKACDYEGVKRYFGDRFMEYLHAHIDDPEHNPGVLVDTEGIQDSRNTPAHPGWAFVSNTDWLQAFYKPAGFMHQHNLSVTGGSKKTKYYASLGLKDQDGVIRYGSDKYQRVNLNLSADIQIAKWLDVSLSTRMNYRKSDVPNVGSLKHGVYYEIYRMYPTMPIFLPNGDWAGMRQYHSNWNVIGIIANSGRRIDQTWDNWYTGRFDFHPIEGLSIKGDYSYNTFFRRYKAHNRIFHQNFPEGREPEPIGVPSSVTNNHENNIYQVLNIWGQYKHTFGDKHNTSFMLGYNQEEKTIYKNALTMQQLLDNNLPVTDMAQEYLKNYEVNTLWRVQGTFFRVNYDYDSKYLLEINGRYDGSSKYAKDDRWAFFPSASFGWNIGKEGFMEHTKDVLEELKLRCSVGMLGNQVTEGLYDYMSIIQSLPLTNYVFDDKLSEGLTTPSIPSLVTWEKVLTYDVGLDWSLWQNRFTGSLDWYIRDTKGMVRTVTLPATFGTSTGKENVADMRTTGWELSMSWRDRINDVAGSPLDYGVGLGLSDYQAEITKYDNPTGALKDFYVGKKIGEIWGYETRGFIQDEAEAELMSEVQKYLSAKWYPGDIRYEDLNADGYINNGKNTLDDPGDRKIIGNSTPRYRYNFTGNLGWHGFNLDFAFEGVGKRDVWISSDCFWGFARDIYNSSVMKWHVDKVWTEENRDAYFPRLTFSGNAKSKRVQTKYLQNAAYLRLKSLTLSYDLPQNVLEKIKISKARLYVSGYNMWEHTHLPPFMTPDIVDQIAGAANLLSENTGKEYTFMRSWSVGLNITF